MSPFRAVEPFVLNWLHFFKWSFCVFSAQAIYSLSQSHKAFCALKNLADFQLYMLDEKVLSVVCFYAKIKS